MCNHLVATARNHGKTKIVIKNRIEKMNYPKIGEDYFKITPIYITAGVGTVEVPMRYQVPREVVIFEL